TDGSRLLARRLGAAAVAAPARRPGGTDRPASRRAGGGRDLDRRGDELPALGRDTAGLRSHRPRPRDARPAAVEREARGRVERIARRRRGSPPSDDTSSATGSEG